MTSHQASASPSNLPSRQELWGRFDELLLRWQRADAAPPAFVQESVCGLWAVQVLVRPAVQPARGALWRLFFDPPSPGQFEPYYDSWPGGHRGWMQFESKEAARNFYKLETGVITFSEYQSLPRAAYSGKRIDLDHNGDFVRCPSDEGRDHQQG